MTRRAALLAGGALLAILPRPGRADNPESSRRDPDAASPLDEPILGSLPLRLSGGATATIDRLLLWRPPQLLVLRATPGVVQRNENRIDVREIPLLGRIFRRSYRPVDFTAASRQGGVYREGTTLLAYLPPEQSAPLSEVTPVVLNSRFSYLFNDGAQAMPPTELARHMPRFAQIRIVARLLETAAAPAPGAPPSLESLVLAGLVTEPRPDIPALAELPLLGRLFAGEAHLRERRELMILIRPSIAAGDRE